MNIILLIVSLGMLTTSLLPMNLSLHNQAPRSEADQTLLDAFVDNDIEMMKFALQELNAQVDTTNKDGATLLEQAVQKSNLLMVELLVENGATITQKINGRASTDTRLASSLNGALSMYHLNHPTKNTSQKENNNINSVVHIPTKKIAAQEYIKEREAFMQTAEPQQHIDKLVAGFLGNDAPAEKKEQEEKKLATVSQPSIVFILEEQEQINQSLRLAAFRNDFAMVETALSMGADINAGDLVGTTALMLAVHASPEMVKKLIISGAAVDKPDAKGLTAFDYAARWFVSCPNTAHWLIKNENLSWKLEEIVVTLVSYGANTYARDYRNGKYEYAVQKGKKEYEASKIEVEKLTAKNDALLRKTQIREIERRLQIEAMERIEREHSKKLNAQDDVLQSRQDVRISANSDNTNWYGDRYAFHLRLRDLSYANDPQSTLHLIKLIEEYGQDKSIFDDAHPIFFLLEVGRIDVVEKL